MTVRHGERPFAEPFMFDEGGIDLFEARGMFKPELGRRGGGRAHGYGLKSCLRWITWCGARLVHMALNVMGC